MTRADSGSSGLHALGIGCLVVLVLAGIGTIVGAVLVVRGWRSIPTLESKEADAAPVWAPPPEVASWPEGDAGVIVDVCGTSVAAAHAPPAGVYLVSPEGGTYARWSGPSAACSGTSQCSSWAASRDRVFAADRAGRILGIDGQGVVTPVDLEALQAPTVDANVPIAASWDGQTVAYSSFGDNREATVIIDLAHGKVLLPRLDRLAPSRWMALSPNGGKLAYATASGLSFLAPLGAKVAAVTIVPWRGAVRNLAWAPDGAHLLAVTEASPPQNARELWVIDAATHAARRIPVPSPPAGYGRGPVPARRVGVVRAGRAAHPGALRRRCHVRAPADAGALRVRRRPVRGWYRRVRLAAHERDLPGVRRRALDPLSSGPALELPRQRSPCCLLRRRASRARSNVSVELRAVGSLGASRNESGAPPTAMGRYTPLARLGHGGMADVFLAVARGPMGFNKLTVVKRLRNSEEAHVQMFLDEARLAARLNHPNIVHTYEVGEVSGRFFIAMEFLEGQSVNARADSEIDGVLNFPDGNFKVICLKPSSTTDTGPGVCLNGSGVEWANGADVAQVFSSLSRSFGWGATDNSTDRTTPRFRRG